MQHWWVPRAAYLFHKTWFVAKFTVTRAQFVSICELIRLVSLVCVSFGFFFEQLSRLTEAEQSIKLKSKAKVCSFYGFLSGTDGACVNSSSVEKINESKGESQFGMQINLKHRKQSFFIDLKQIKRVHRESSFGLSDWGRLCVCEKSTLFTGRWFPLLWRQKRPHALHNAPPFESRRHNGVQVDEQLMHWRWFWRWCVEEVEDNGVDSWYSWVGTVEALYDDLTRLKGDGSLKVFGRAFLWTL